MVGAGRGAGVARVGLTNLCWAALQGAWHGVEAVAKFRQRDGHFRTVQQWATKPLLQATK